MTDTETNGTRAASADSSPANCSTRVIIVGEIPIELTRKLDALGIAYNVLKDVAEAASSSLEKLADDLINVIEREKLPKIIDAKSYGVSLQRGKRRFS